MGILKKVFGENGVFAKLAGSNQRGSHQLVCQQLAARHQQTNHGHYITTTTTSNSINNRHPQLAQFQQQTIPVSNSQQKTTVLFQDTSNNNTITTHQQKRSRRRQARKQHEVACLTSLEAEMLASLSQMPALKFNPIHGIHAELSDNQMSARRTQSFCEAIVFSDRIIMPNERIYVRVLDIAKGWNGTIRFGFTSCDPDKFRYEPMPKHVCPDMTQAGHTWAHALADKLVKRDTIIHFSYSPSGFIQYGINNQECGVFVAKVKTSEPLWFVIDIYGLTTAIELIDPRQAQSQNEENVLFAGQQHVRRSSSLALSAGNSQHTRYERRAAKLAAATFQQQQQKLLQAARSASRTRTTNQSMAYLNRQQQRANFLNHESHAYQTHRLPVDQITDFDPSLGEDLPYLSNIVLPISRQNIYTSLPIAQQQHQEQQHYYQLQSASSLYGNATQISSNATLSSAAAVSTDRLFNQEDTSNNIDSTISNRRNSSNGTTALDDSVITSNANESNSSQNLVNTTSRSTSNLHYNSTNIQSTNNSNTQERKSQASNQRTPIAATRRTQRNQANTMPASSSSNCHQGTASKSNQNSGSALKARDCNSQSTSGNNSRIKQSNAKASPNNATVKQMNANINNNVNSKSNNNNNNSSISRDKNNSSPMTKDCPICFERPINCVLYQCGHMCTCYECGVKQWRTQSRTCPICRTVIKDVIKTYLS